VGKDLETMILFQTWSSSIEGNDERLYKVDKKQRRQHTKW
jgi:hypothetical protein